MAARVVDRAGRHVTRTRSGWEMRKSAFILLVLLLSVAGCGEDSGSTPPELQESGEMPVKAAALTPTTNEEPQLPAVEQGAWVRLGNGLVEISFDPRTGKIVQLCDLRHTPSLSLLDIRLDTGHVPPWEIEQIVAKPFLPLYELLPLEVEIGPPVFVRGADSLTIIWENAPPLPTVEATWTVPPGEPELRMTARVLRQGEAMIYNLRYPILPGLAHLGDDPADDCFLTTKEGGSLLFDPLDHLGEDLKFRHPALSEQEYPIGHEAMAQMVAYLRPGTGGLLLYTADADFGFKTFNLWQRPADEGKPLPVIGSLDLDHLNPDLLDEAGTGEFAVTYPTVLRWLDQGTWEEAAEIYRAWSDQQVWAANPVAERDEDERRFFEQLGASIFGLSAREDQRPWIEAFRRELVEGIDEAKLLFVLGWDFHPLGVPDEPEYLLAMYQAGWHERYWSPLMGHSEDNIAQAQQQGDWVMPFYYDLMVHSGYPNWNGYGSQPATGDDRGAPWYKHSLVNYEGLPGGFVLWIAHHPGLTYTLCPADPVTIDFWRWRDRLLTYLPEQPFDGLYFDLGFPVVLHGCYDHLTGGDHGHPSGAGGYLVAGVREALDFPRGTANPRGYRYGAENVPEPYIDLVDFWHLGASGDGPLRDKEGVDNQGQPLFANINKWIMEGSAVQVPLMTYLHHHNGAVRTGGKMQISYEIGDAFYRNAGAQYLWGGVVELIYYNAPVDWLPSLYDLPVFCQGAVPCAFQTSWGSGFNMPRGWYYGEQAREADPDKIEYLRQAIRLRVDSPASAYLTLGRMKQPPRIEPWPEPIAYSYDYYSSIMGSDCCHAGEWTAQPLVVAAWRHPYAESVALLFANTGDETIETHAVIDPSLYHMTQAELWRVDWQGKRGDELLGSWQEPQEPAVIAVSIDPHDFLMIELRP